MRFISYCYQNYFTPPPAPPRKRGGEIKHSFGKVSGLISDQTDTKRRKDSARRLAMVLLGANFRASSYICSA